MKKETWDTLTRVRTIPALDRLNERIRAFSQGDKVIFYTLVILAAIAAISGISSLENSLL